MNQFRKSIAAGFGCQWPDFVLFAFLVMFGVASRWIIDTPNFQPAFAIALFAGFVFRNRAMALVCPLVVIFVSDLGIGGYHLLIAASVYTCFAIGAVMGRFINRHNSALKNIIAITFAATLLPVLFFVVTNFAFWKFAGIYPESTDGLWACYTNAMAFFRNSLVASILFSWILFGSYYAIQAIENKINSKLVYIRVRR